MFIQTVCECPPTHKTKFWVSFAHASLGIKYWALDCGETLTFHWIAWPQESSPVPPPTPPPTVPSATVITSCFLSTYVCKPWSPPISIIPSLAISNNKALFVSANLLKHMKPPSHIGRHRFWHGKASKLLPVWTKQFSTCTVTVYIHKGSVYTHAHADLFKTKSRPLTPFLVTWQSPTLP